MHTASVSGGAVPLNVKLSSAGSKDYDGDSLKYEWTIHRTRWKNSTILIKNQIHPSALDQPGASYMATLTVTSQAGLKNSQVNKNYCRK